MMMLKIALAWSLITAVLKLAGVVQWSWWVVFGPTLILLLIVVGAIALVALGALSKGK